MLFFSLILKIIENCRVTSLTDVFLFPFGDISFCMIYAKDQLSTSHMNNSLL